MKIAFEDEFDPSAVELCARKVAAVTGDLRKALDVCRMSLDRTSTPKRRKFAVGRKRELSGGWVIQVFMAVKFEFVIKLRGWLYFRTSV